jgi:hypothetical protein
VALCPRDAAESDSLLKAALLDRYSTRGVGRPARKPPRGMAPADELAMTTRLHQAIDERTFHLDYQPVFELATRRMIGVEALLRWRDPFGNPIPPDAFIPLAERTGLIAPITDWVIEQVCRQRLAWRTAGIELDIGFNFPTTLWDGRTVAQVLSTIRGFGLRPADLVMEVTESTAMQDETATATVTEMLRSSGMRLAIDDFGTGYSSPAPPPRLDDQGRPHLRPRHPPRPRIGRRGHHHRPPGREPRRDHPGRGHRDRGPAPLPARAGLHQRPGVPVLTPAAGRRGRAAVAGRGQAGGVASAK